MKIIVSILLLVMGLAAKAQYPAALPSSGPLSTDMIKDWMYAAGEITFAEYSGATSLAFLNSKSHLTDKTAPYSISDWYGYSVFVFNVTLTVNTSQYNVKTAAIAAGWDQTNPLLATVTINTGVVVYSAAGSGVAAFNTGSTFPVGSSMTIINKGSIVGYSGLGAAYGSAGNGSAGGWAVETHINITINNTNGNIYGGGGGGGGGGNNALGGGGGTGGNGAGAGPGGLISATGGGAPGLLAGAGGAGGGYGASGSTGIMGALGAPGSGGAGGAATSSAGYTITWTGTGTRLGTIG
ncbi:MAG: hypothetical protein V4557_08255 [Bacteroidota bacterium]